MVKAKCNNFIQHPSLSNALSMSYSESLSQWTDAQRVIEGLSGGLAGYLSTFRRVGQWMTAGEYANFNKTGIIPRGNVLMKGSAGFSDINLTHYVEFSVHQSLLRTKDAARGWQQVIPNSGIRQRLATQRGLSLPDARAYDIKLIQFGN